MTTVSARTGSSHVGHGRHGHHGRHAHHAPRAGQAPVTLVVHTEPTTPVAGQPTTLRLELRRGGGTLLSDFAVLHEEKVHLMVVRDGLDHFAHLHPEVDAAGNLTARHTFPAGGTYRLYADYQPGGQAPATAAAELQVAGHAPAAPPLTPDVPGVAGGDGLLARVDVRSRNAGAGATIRFALTDPAGQPVTDLQPYMGERGHLVVLSGDGGQYVHAHPVADGAAGGSVVAFEAHFRKPGLYKGWGQFRRQGKVLVIPFVLSVA